MPTLGVTVTDRTSVPARGVPTDTGVAFVIGPASAGPTVPTEVRSMADFESLFAGRTGVTIPTWDWLDVFFREGGARAYVTRISGSETYVDALPKIAPELGPGQLAIAAHATAPDATQYTALLLHAKNNNRFALLDVASDADTVAELNTAGGIIPSTNNDRGALFAPWLNVPAPSNVVGGSVRQVPASAVVAALCARADALGNPNRAPAGRDFPLAYATGFLGSDPGMAVRSTMLDGGVNTFALRFGVLQLYGFQTDVAQAADTPFWQANCARTRMWIKARAEEIGENYVFDTIDGRGMIAAQLKTDIEAELLVLYGADGLFGETPQEAFAVTVNSAINTIQTIAQGELHAVIEARLSLHAKSVIIDLVSVPVGGRVGASAS
jgi:hypothetical protein